jgi:hypothetical protein
MKRTIATLLAAAAPMLCSALPDSVMAATAISQWLSPTSGNWTTASNWSTNPFYPDNGQPNAGDQYQVLIDKTGAPYTVSLTPKPTVSSVTINSSDAHLQLVDGLTTNSLNVTGGTVTVGATTCCTHSLDVFDDITLDNGTIRLVMDDFLSDPTWVRFMDTASPQFIKGTGKITFAQGRFSEIYPFKELNIGANIVVDSTNGSGEFRNGRVVSNGMIRSGPNTTLDLRVADLVNNGTIEVGGFTTIGAGSTSTWDNAGTIRIKPGGSLTLFGKFTIDNLGTLIDEGAARIWLAGIFDNTGRTLDLNSLGLTVPLQLNGGEIRGGIVTTSGPGTIAFIPGIDARLNGVTLASNFTVAGSAGGARVFVNNGLTLDHSTLTVQEGANLLFDGSAQTLSGSGTILATNLPLTSAITTIAGDNLTIGDGITIRNGTESFRELQVHFKENRGTIIAEAPNSLVTIGANTALSAGPLWKNNGIIRVSNGTVQFWGTYSVDDLGTLDYTGGEIILNGNLLNQGKAIAQNPSTGVWKLRGTVYGGRIESSGGVMADVAGTFDNVTLAGPATLFDEPNSTASGALWIPNKLTFDGGTLTVDRFAELSINQIVELAGNGQILLNGTPQDSLIQTFTGGQVTIGPHIAVRTGPSGGGAISRATLPVINQGTISAETKDKMLVVGGTLTNTGLLQAKNNSTLRLDPTTWTNQGQMKIDAGKITITGTSFTNGATGTISGRGDFELTRAPLINNGTLSPGLPLGQLNVKGGLTLQSAGVTQIELGGLNDFDSITVSLNAILGGALNVSLTNGFHLSLNRTFLILNTTGTSTGQFAGLPEGARIGAFDHLDLFITYKGGNGNDVALFTIPEPLAGPSLATIAVMLTAARIFRRRRHNLWQ